MSVAPDAVDGCGSGDVRELRIAAEARDDFEAEAPARPTAETLHVDLEGFAGPLDLLLDLARREKIDLSRVKILPLAQQYLAFVARAETLRIELAADLLVMAAWLAYLKSRLIVPQDESDGDDAEELAEDLAFRLRRLEAMRNAADALAARPRLGRDVFARGAPDKTVVRLSRSWSASLYDLLSAYGDVRQGEIARTMTLEKRAAFSLVDARRIMERTVGRGAEWLPLERLINHMPAGEDRRGLLASTFGAALEMVREGELSLRQHTPFGPLFVRRAQERQEAPSND